MDSENKLLQYAVLLGSAAFCSWGAIRALLRSRIALLFKDKPDPRKMHVQPIPRLGGVAIVSTFLLLSIFAFFVGRQVQFMSFVPISVVYGIILASSVILVVGFFDDTSFVTVRVRHKLVMEFLVAFSAVYVFGINLGELSVFGFFTIPAWVGNIVSFLWISGLANAYNIIDGLDGLAGSLALIAVITLAVFAQIGGQVPLVVLSLILAGSIIGFLFHNMPPAKTFMGDTGSLFLGSVIAVLSLQIGREMAGGRAIVVMPLIAGVPVIEVFLTMVRRYFRAKDQKHGQLERLHRMVIPDNSHIHHRFMYRGYSPIQSTMVLSILAVNFSVGAICTLLVPEFMVPVIMAYLAVPLVLTLEQLGFGGRFKRALHISKSRYNGFKKPSLVGVVDHSGGVSGLLSGKNGDGVEYVDIDECDIPLFLKYLHTAIIHNEDEPSEETVRKAEKLSFVLRRPVFVVQSIDDADMLIKRVSRNGALVVHEKVVTFRQFIRDVENAGVIERVVDHKDSGIDMSAKNIEFRHASVC